MFIVVPPLTSVVECVINTDHIVSLNYDSVSRHGGNTYYILLSDKNTVTISAEYYEFLKKKLLKIKK